MTFISAIVLAAGLSSRMAPRNKLLLDRGGMPLVRRSVLNVLTASLSEVVVVTGHMAAEITTALAGLPVRIVYNAAYRDGMGSSLACGARSVSPEAEAVLVCLGDMPDIATGTIAFLLQGFDLPGSHMVCVPSFRGMRGHPALFGREFFGALAALEGDAGARAILRSFPDRVRVIEVDDPGILLDVDTLPDGASA